MVRRSAINAQKQAWSQNQTGMFASFLSYAIRSALCVYLAAVASLFSVSVSANDLSECDETDSSPFFSLINAAVDPYLPALDRNGNTLLSVDDVFIQKSQHYFLTYKDYEPVSISMERFAAMTELNAAALENFESKITILGPGCQKINLYSQPLQSQLHWSFQAAPQMLQLKNHSLI